MSIRHRCLAVCLALTAIAFLSSNQTTFAADSAQPSGEVGLRELIQLALKNDPKLVQLRSQIPVEEAKKRAIPLNQWRDPELRLEYSRDNNIQLDQPFERSGQVTERFDTTSSENTSGTDGPGSEQTSSTEVRNSSFTERVEPGRFSETVTRTETEERTTDSSTTTRDSGGIERENSSETETIRSTRQETNFDSRDSLARDDTASAKIRFWIPKPWEKKALLKQASKEIDLANYTITAAEREVILEVREHYEDLQYLYKRLKASTSKISIIEEHRKREAEIFDISEELTVDDLGIEDLAIPGIKMEQEELLNDLRRAKSELAARVGLKDGSRIRVTDRLLRSNIDLQAADLDYLIKMAYVHRGEIGVLQHQQAITESELDIINAQRIPWLSFVEGSYARDRTGGNRTNDNWGIQAGVTLPFFSWLSKDEEVVQAQIQAQYASLEANQRHIAVQVEEAFRSVKEAGRSRGRAQSATTSAAKKMDGMKKRLEGSEDPLAIEKLRYEIASRVDDFSRYTRTADRRYNQALIRLERALGADLNQVFNYKFEPIAGQIADEGEVLAAAAASSQSLRPAPKAKPVPKKIDLPSQIKKKPATEKSESTKPKRKGLFSRLKNSEKETKAEKEAKAEKEDESKPAKKSSPPWYLEPQALAD